MDNKYQEGIEPVGESLTESTKLKKGNKGSENQITMLSLFLFISFLLTIGLLFGFIGFSESPTNIFQDGINLSMRTPLSSQPKIIREKIESILWKEKLRQHINREEPAFYARFPAPNPKVVDNPYIPPETYSHLLELSVIVYSPDHLNIIIRDAEDIKWELPHEDPYAYVPNPKYMNLSESNFICRFYNPFGLVIIRKETMEEIFSLTDRLVFADKYVEFSFQMPTNEVHGFGERLFTFNYKPGTYSLFILDRSGEIEERRPGFNSHGHHSVYLVREKSKKAHINLIRNVNAHEFTLDEEGKIRYQMNGGVIDLNFFLGENHDDAVQKYHTYLGGWILPAFWMMGHQQSKWNGYSNTTHLRQVLEKYEERKLPLDTLNNDIEYMEVFFNFQLDEKRYPPQEMKALFTQYKKRWIPMCNPYVLDFGGPGLAYPNVDEILMKNQNGTTWAPGFLMIPDFMHPNCSQFNYAMLDHLDKQAHISGIWLDGNEVTVGPPTQEEILRRSKTSKYYNLTWFPGTKNFYHLHIPPIDNLHYGGVEEYDSRSLQCLHQANHAFNYFKTRPNDPQRFPFVLSRATTFGIGKYARTFIPDYKSDWECLKISVATCMIFNVFGIPFIGGDLGGNGGHKRTPAELMARWYQLGIFYPYARNHHMFQVPGFDNYQEPYQYDGIYYETIVSCLKLRYAFLKYYYTLFFLNPGTELRTGSVFRPLAFVFHSEATMPSYDHEMHNEQFMVGDNLLVTPVLFRATEHIQAYFPNARWYDLRDNIEVPARGAWHTVIAPLPDITPYFLRGGSIFYKQNVDKVMATADLDSIFQMTIGLGDIDDENVGTAKGFILNVQSYDEYTVYDHCTFGDCLLEVKATFDFNKDQFIFESTKKTLTSYGETQFINELNILGVEKSALKYQNVDLVSTNADANHSSSHTSLRIYNEERWIQIVLSSNIELRDGVKYIFSFHK